MKQKLMKTALGLMTAACLMASHNASAQSNAPWPSKPIRFVVTFPA